MEEAKLLVLIVPMVLCGIPKGCVNVCRVMRSVFHYVVVSAYMCFFKVIV